MQDEEDEEEPDRENIFQGGNAVLNAVKHRKLGWKVITGFGNLEVSGLVRAKVWLECIEEYRGWGRKGIRFSLEVGVAVALMVFFYVCVCRGTQVGQ